MGFLKKVNSEVVFELALLILGLIIMGVSLQYGFGSLKKPGSGLYPFLIGSGIAVSFFLLLVIQLRKRAAIAPLSWDRQKAKTFIFMAATFSLWLLLMNLLGYVLVSILVTYLFCKIMKLEGWVKPLAISGATALFIYLLFDYWLYIDLPRGLLG